MDRITEKILQILFVLSESLPDCSRVHQRIPLQRQAEKERSVSPSIVGRKSVLSDNICCISVCFEGTVGWAGVPPRQPTVICRLLVPRYLNRDVVSDLFRALNFSGDVSGPVLLVDGRDKSAQLNRAIERFHLYPIELIFDVLSQRSVDADRSVLIVNSFASGLLVATLGGGRGGDGWWSRAAGHAQKQWHCADAEDQRQPLKRSARVYRCVFHISSCVFDVVLMLVCLPTKQNYII